MRCLGCQRARHSDRTVDLLVRFAYGLVCVIAQKEV